MRLAAYNVENMFDRAKAMNLKTWADGKPALTAHRELNDLFNRATYTTANKTRMLTLLEQQGLLRKDDGPYLWLRRIRGKLLNRPTQGSVKVAATGRADWIGWVDLKTEHVDAIATETCARVMRTVDADVLGVVEAENRITLALFNALVMTQVGGVPYEHVMLIDGNDDRGIDVGMLTKANFPILSIRSHVNDRDNIGPIFSRDCAEYEIGLPGGGSMWVLVNHLKSKGYGAQRDNDARRLRQAQRIRDIVDAHVAIGHSRVAVIGDFNDLPASAPLAPLLGNGSPLNDVAASAAFDDGGRPGTHRNCTASSKIDYILLTDALFAQVSAAGIERRGMWGGVNGTLWPHFLEMTKEIHAGSDHAALWVDLAI